jgi:hypothetical protein
MKWIGNIFILTLIWIICGARSCNENDSLKEQREKNLLSASKDSIKQVSEIDSPTDQNLKGYETTAILKLQDFADYLKIVSDSSMDLTFRKQAAEMAGKIFISGEIDTRNLSKFYQRQDLTTFNKLLENLLEQGSSCWIQPEQIDVLKPLTMENDSTFKGRLSFTYKCIPFEKLNSAQGKSGKLKIDIYAVKKIKSFGKEQFRVWEVNLGDID